jgi:peptidoglycan/xylan/chitin deacetylase (PgdA/CDA1 family)
VLGAMLCAAVLAVVVVATEAGGSRTRPVRGGRATDVAPTRDGRATAAARADDHARLKRREDQAISRILAYTPFVREGGHRKREVALTFDDGPGPYTPRILRLLRHRHAHATFFEVGSMLTWFHRSTSKEIRDGDVVGDHTMDHVHMGQLPLDPQRSELLDQASALHRYGAPDPRLFRPPYGSFNRQTLDVLRRERMLMVLWSTDTEDYTVPGADAIADRALAGAHPGAIILLHDGGGDRSQTVAALPRIVHGIRARHLRLVTVPRLLLDDPPPRQQSIPWELAGSGS